MSFTKKIFVTTKNPSNRTSFQVSRLDFPHLKSLPEKKMSFYLCGHDKIITVGFLQFFSGLNHFDQFPVFSFSITNTFDGLHFTLPFTSKTFRHFFRQMKRCLLEFNEQSAISRKNLIVLFSSQFHVC
jgi:hypothetical protein